MSEPTTIVYAPFGDAEDLFARTLDELMRRPDVRRVIEIGGGANPTLHPDEAEALGLEYTVLDISPEELAKTPESYRTIVADIAAPGGLPRDVVGDGFDLAFSRMLAEHVPDGGDFHRNVHALLAPGGRAVHYNPTLWYPWFVLNRLLPDELAEKILLRIQPHRRPQGRKAKFPAPYSWCRGPTRRQLARLRAVGYEIETYRGFFGTGYLQKVPPLFALERAVMRLLLRFPVPALTSYSLVQLRRPA